MVAARLRLIFWGLMGLWIVLHEEQNDQTQRELYFCVPRIYFAAYVNTRTKCTNTKHNCYGYEAKKQRNKEIKYEQ